MHAFTGKILFVDLGRKSTTIQEKDASFYKQHLGGAFLAAELFAEFVQDMDRAAVSMDSAPLVFATGPLAGASICGSTRVNVVSFSPEAGGIFTSQGGGEFGPDMKRAGFDALVISGESSAPVFLDIHNDAVRFEDAADLWGQDRLTVYDRLAAGSTGKMSIASIGPAGENRVRHANIMFEPDHYAGRGGLGAVMGAKKLKAIRIGGDHSVNFKDGETVKAINKSGAKAFAASFAKNPQSFLGVLKNYGTYGLMTLCQNIGNLPVLNFRQGWMDDPDFDAAITHAAIGEAVVGKAYPCKWCYLGCKKRALPGTNLSSLAEYESMAMLGPNLGLTDLSQIMEANEMCNRLGLDTISTGALIAYLMDGFENGDLDADALGCSVRFGDAQVVHDLIRMMAYRQGRLGELLADGIDACCQALGDATRRHRRFAGGIGIPAHMPRAKPGIGFGYFHGPNPGDHMKAEHDWIASSPDDLKLFGLEETSTPEALDAPKVTVYRATQIYYAAMDSLSLCMFVFGPGNTLSADDIVRMVNAATGFDYTFDGLMQIGEAALQLQRDLYVRFGGKDDDMPAFMEQAIPEGPSKGNRISRTDFDSARQHYYKIWHWDSPCESSL